MYKFRTQEQAILSQELCLTYQIDPQQVIFVGESSDPILDYEALSKISLELCPEIQDLQISLDTINQDFVSCSCLITVGGKTRKVFSVCMMNERITETFVVDSIDRACNVARARALRAGLRSIGFDPMKAHAQKVRGSHLELVFKEKDRNKELAQIHVLATEIGLIKGKDSSKYRRVLNVFFGKQSAKGFTDEEREKCIAILRSLKHTLGNT